MLFGPIMAVYFVTLTVLGVINILPRPDVLVALNPLFSVQFFITDGFTAFLSLGALMLEVTGAEALYADMGHFGRRPIRVSRVYFVLPPFMITYQTGSATLR